MTLFYGLPHYPKVNFKNEPLKNGDYTNLHPLYLRHVYPDFKLEKIVYYRNGERVPNIIRPPYFEAMHMLYSFKKTFNSVGNVEKLLKFMKSRYLDKFWTAKLNCYLEGQDALNFLKNGGSDRVVVTKRGKYKKCTLVHPNNVFNLFDKIVMIDLDDMCFDEVFNVLLYCGDNVYYDKMRFVNVFCANDGDDLPTEIFNEIYKTCMNDFRKLKIIYTFEPNPINFKKTCVDGVCHVCKKATNRVQYVQSFVRITDELQAVDFICENCVA